MKFKDLFQDIEEWFWKLEFNPETNSYELYMGIPNDWIYSGNNKDVSIDLVHEMEQNSMIRISTPDESLSVDDIIDTAKLLIVKNQELERKKRDHKNEMERLKNILIETEKKFLVYIDTVKDTKGDGIAEIEEPETTIVVETPETVVVEVEDIAANNFMEDIQK